MSWATELEDRIAARVREELQGTPPVRRLLKRREAAEYLACDEKQILNYVASGELAAVRTDTHLRFDVRDLDKFIEAHKA